MDWRLKGEIACATSPRTTALQRLLLALTDHAAGLRALPPHRRGFIGALSSRKIEQREVDVTRLLVGIAAGLVLIAAGIAWLLPKMHQTVHQGETVIEGQKKAAENQDKLAAQLSQVQEALSRIQQNTDPKRDPIGEWPRERLEAELARQMKIKVEDLRAILAAGQTSLDALLQGQSLLASGKPKEAGEKFDVVIQQEKEAMQRLRQAYAGKAQIAFDAVKYEEALQFREKAAALVDKAADPVGWADAQGWVAFIDLYLARHEHAEPLMKEVVRLQEEHLGR